MDSSVLFVAGGAFLGPTIASVAGIWYSSLNARRAQEDALKAQLATAKAAKDAAIAQKQAFDAAALLQQQVAAQAQALFTAANTVAAGQNATTTRLALLQTTADGTHEIVNHARTVMLKMIAALTQRIALENPDDSDARTHAESAAEEARKAAATPVNPPSQEA